MIDLGDELDGYSDGDEPARPTRPGQPTPTPAPGGGSTAPLADLQAAGFRTGVPAATGSFTDKIIRGSILLNHLLNDEPPHPLADDSDVAAFGGKSVTWRPADEPGLTANSRRLGDDDSPPGPTPTIDDSPPGPTPTIPGDPTFLGVHVHTWLPGDDEPCAGDEDDDHA